MALRLAVVRVSDIYPDRVKVLLHVNLREAFDEAMADEPLDEEARLWVFRVLEDVELLLRKETVKIP